MKNVWFLQKIELLSRLEGISIKTIKVKGHSGIVGNDLADDMANKGANSFRNIYSPYIDQTSNLSFFAYFKSRPIDTAFRKFITNTFHSYYMTEWAFLSVNQDRCQIRQDDID